MKKTVLAILLISCSLWSYCQTAFQRNIGTTATAEMGSSIQQTTDGGYILSAQSGSLFYLIKLTATGDTTWIKHLMMGGGYTHNVQQTSDGGYVIAGFEADMTSGMNDFCLVKTNATGDTLWTRAYQGSPDVMNISVQQTTDGGYILLSTTDSFGVGTYDLILMRASSTGALLWSKTYGKVSSTTQANSVQQTSDGGFILTGAHIGTIADWNIVLIKTDNTGAVTWSNVYGHGVISESGSAVRQTSDGGYIVSGNQQGAGADPSNAILLKIDASGNQTWTKRFSGANLERFNNVQQTTDGGYIAIGTTSSYGAGNKDVLMVKTDATGGMVFAKTFGGTANEECYGLQQTTDKGYITTGMTTSFGADAGGNIYIIKTDSNGHSTGCGETAPAIVADTQVFTAVPVVFTVGAGGPVGQITHFDIPSSMSVSDPCVPTSLPATQEPADAVAIFPNPMYGAATLRLNISKGIDQASICIYDLPGREVRHISITSSETTIYPTGMEPGLYFYRVFNGGALIGSGKLSIR